MIGNRGRNAKVPEECERSTPGFVLAHASIIEDAAPHPGAGEQTARVCAAMRPANDHPTASILSQIRRRVGQKDLIKHGMADAVPKSGSHFSWKSRISPNFLALSALTHETFRHTVFMFRIS
jgi:hypothetical protein